MQGALGAGWCSVVPGAKKRPCGWFQDEQGSRVPRTVEMMQQSHSAGMLFTRDTRQPQVGESAAAVGGTMASVDTRPTVAYIQPSDGDGATDDCHQRYTGYKLEVIF